MSAQIRAVIVGMIFSSLAFLSASSASGAEAKPGAAWDKVVAAARTEGALTIYGYTGDLIVWLSLAVPAWGAMPTRRRAGRG